MDRYRGDRYGDYSTTSYGPNYDNRHHYYDGDDRHYHHHHHHQDRHYYNRYHEADHLHPNFNGEENYTTSGTSGHHDSNLPLSGHKRPFFQSEFVDFVKLFVGGVPRTITEQDIRSVFGEYGHIVEVILLRDKWSGVQQECCFVKYAMVEAAERAIVRLNGQYIFPGGTIPIKVKFADGEHERLGSFGYVHKLYVGCVNKQSSKQEIEEIFTPFGSIEDIYIVRDEFKQNRGCVFVQFSCRDMAIAAITALHGRFMMRGCDQPLIVRFADPKKPRAGDSRPSPYVNDQFSGHMLPNEIRPVESPQIGRKPPAVPSTCSASAAYETNSSSEMTHSIDCDWSEHVCPDGHLYYYNCVTCESRWEKPEEYAHYELELEKLEQQQQESKPQVLSSPEVSQKQPVQHKPQLSPQIPQMELNHVQEQATTIAGVEPAIV